MHRTYAPVRNLMLYLTEDCNLRCTYCFVEKRPRRMTSEIARKSVDFFLSRSVSGGHYALGINFFGGEPFLELERMEEVIEYACRVAPEQYKAVTFSATTNGTVASPRVERIVSSTSMFLLISMDGGQEANARRPLLSGRNPQRLLERNLPRLVTWSPNAIVRMTFDPDSLDLVGSATVALELGAPSVALCPVVEADWRGHETRLEVEYGRLADWYIARARAGQALSLYVTNSLLRHIHRARGAPGRPARPCGIGSVLLGIDPDGNVMPCHRYISRPHERLGTVEQPDLPDERWDYVHLSSSDFAECAGCTAAHVCGGGCRAVARNAGLALNQPHPNHCLLMRAHERAAARVYEALTAEQNAALASLLAGSDTHPAIMSELATR